MVLATTARSTPTGAKLKDGYQSLVAFAANASVKLWEKQVTPPSVETGDMVDQTTMHNVTWETFAMQHLIKMGNGSMVCAYDPKVYDELMALVGVETTITIHFSNGATLDAYGGLISFTPSAMVKGSQPEGTAVFGFTNAVSTTGVETAPNYKTPSGTD